MNVIERAERRYRELVPSDLISATPVGRRRRLPATQIEAWITDYVLPAVEEVWERPIFREHATWPQRSLAAEAGTEERAAVDRCDAALIAEAKALKTLAGNALVSRHLDDTYRDATAKRDAMNSTVVIDGEVWVQGLPTRHELIPFYRRQLDEVASRAWTDLVCTDDYFGPAGGMMRKSALPEGTTEAATIVSLNPGLYHVGDSVTRCLLQRVRIWTGCLAETRSVVYEAIRHVNRPYEKQVEAEQAARAALHQRTNELQRYCLVGPEARTRESCITLVQVVGEFHPAAELRWLGLREYAIHQFRGELRQNLTVQQDLETLDRIATAVADLAILYRGLDPSFAAHDEAIAGGGLVLIEATRKAFWQGREIPVEWDHHRKPWELLWKLAANARMASEVSHFDLYNEGVASSTIYNRWSRLKALIPATLAREVVPGHERTTYRLRLSIHQIHLFALTNSGSTSGNE